MTIDLSRRSAFLGVICAPAIVKASSLMRIRVLDLDAIRKAEIDNQIAWMSAEMERMLMGLMVMSGPIPYTDADLFGGKLLLFVADPIKIVEFKVVAR